MIKFYDVYPNQPHNSVGRALDLKTRGCGFDSGAGQPNNYQFGRDFQPRSRVTVLYTEHVKNQAELSVV